MTGPTFTFEGNEIGQGDRFTVTRRLGGYIHDPDIWTQTGTERGVSGTITEITEHNVFCAFDSGSGATLFGLKPTGEARINDVFEDFSPKKRRTDKPAPEHNANSNNDEQQVT